MAIERWQFPTQILFGAGAVSRAGAELAALGGRRALVVTDPGVRRAGLSEPLVASLRAGGLAAAVFDGVAGNPVEDNVDDGARAWREAAADCVLAVGGGSALDVAKLVALRAGHDRPLADYDDARGGDRLIGPGVPPIVTVPTTAGTGSEVGRSAVVTLRATGRKTVIFSPHLLARVAILDPEMTRSLPPPVTAATGFDALTHAVEALVARGDHPLADSIALGAVRLVARSLARAVDAGDDLGARGDMLKAAMMGAVAFQKGLGACHSLAHPLSSQLGLHHGLANALCLPAVVRFNLACPKSGAALAERYAEVARLLGPTPEASACADALEALRERVGLPGGLGEAGVREEHIARLADEAAEDACHTLNPRPCTRADMIALYRASL
jgi:alcohol dehydrogenase class IV